ncbi:J domain-containing protein [Shewanella sp.]|uniref:J domain-containing protein n=1 Tax=Shewanella sp. TaxID=50422 RepID=UPI003A96D6FB
MSKLTITAATIKAPQQRIPTSWAKVRKLWEQIEKKQAANERYERKISKFFEQFSDKLKTHELEICAANAALISHLINFFPRKSLSNRQRETLADWIEQELMALEANPFRANSTEPLRQQFQQAMMEVFPEPNPATNSAACDFFREQVEQLTGMPLDLDDEQLVEIIKDPELFAKFISELEGNSAEQTFDFSVDDDVSDDWEPEWADAAVSSDSIELFRHKDINRLYKQLAKVFHPDKAQSDEDKQRNHQLMQQLSLAKKDNDIFVMMHLAQQWLPGLAIELDDNAIKHFEQSLQQKLQGLNEDYQELKYGNDIKSMVWNRFGAGNKREREQILVHYQQDLVDNAKELNELIAQLSTVKSLQAELSRRAAVPSPLGEIQQIMAHLQAEGFEFEDMFGK